MQAPSRQLCRNRNNIKVVPIPATQDDGQSCTSQPIGMMTHTEMEQRSNPCTVFLKRGDVVTVTSCTQMITLLYI